MIPELENNKIFCFASRYTQLILTMLALLLSSKSSSAADYYVDSVNGTTGAGHGTSSVDPWKFLSDLPGTYSAGDRIFLARGSVWDEELNLAGSGNSTNWITVDAYGTGALPRIERSGTDAEERTVFMDDPSYWSVSNLELAKAGRGIYVKFTTANHVGLRFSNIYVHDMELIYQHSPVTADDAWASIALSIENSGVASTLPTNEWLLKDVVITKLVTDRVIEPLVIVAGENFPDHFYQDIVVRNCDFRNFRLGNGLRSIRNSIFLDNYIDRAGFRYKASGFTTIFVERADNLFLVNNVMKNISHQTSPDKSFIDIERWDKNVIVASNFFSGASGPGIEFLALSTNMYDYNDDHQVVANIFSGNNTSRSTTYKSSLLRIDGSSGAQTFSGEAADNFYFEWSGFLNNAALFPSPDWSFSNNNAVNTAASIFNSANDFDGIQGTNRWTYELYNGTHYVKMTYDSTDARWESADAYISRFNQQTDDDSSTWTVRRWTAPDAGVISVRGWILKNEITGGDGVDAKITKNGTIIWPVGGTPEPIAYNDRVGVPTFLDSISVSADDVIRFEINNGGSSDNTADLTSWVPTIVYTQDGPGDGLVGYWKGDEVIGEGSVAPTRTNDHSGLGNDGVMTSGATWDDDAGIRDGAISLDGTNDYVEIGDDATLEGMNALTVAAWIKLDALPTSTNHYSIIGKDGSGTNQSYRIGINSTGNIYLAIKTQNNGFASSDAIAVSGVPLTTGVWYHVVGTYDGYHVRIYVNGMEEDRTDISPALEAIWSSGTVHLRFGHEVFSAWTYTDGLLDEVKIYNRALTGVQVQELYEVYRPSDGGEFLVNEDFEANNTAANPSGWTVTEPGGTNVSVEAVPSALDKSLSIDDNSTSTLARAKKTFAPQTGLIMVEWKWKEVSAGNWIRGVLLDGSTAAIDIATKIAASGEKRLIYMTANSTVGNTILAPIADNTWYTIRLVIDPVADNFDIFVNGVRMVNNASFNNPVGDIDAIEFHSNSVLTDDAYVDDVKVVKYN